MRVRNRWAWLGSALALLACHGAALAQDAAAPPKIDTGDTAFVLVSAALVMLLQRTPLRTLV